MTPASLEALANLRHTEHLTWSVIPLLAIAYYVYANEIRQKNWNVVLAGLAFWGMDWLNEIINGLVLHYTQYSALWTAPGRSSYTIFVGLNVEICFMFAIAGVALAKILPEDPKKKILGINNRLFIAVANSVFCVFVEILLNRADMLIWAYPFWNVPNVFLIVIFGYLHFHLVAFWVHDMKKMRSKLITVGTLYSLALVGVLVFGVGLRWI